MSSSGLVSLYVTVRHSSETDWLRANSNLIESIGLGRWDPGRPCVPPGAVSLYPSLSLLAELLPFMSPRLLLVTSCSLLRLLGMGLTTSSGISVPAAVTECKLPPNHWMPLSCQSFSLSTSLLNFCSELVSGFCPKISVKFDKCV